MSASWVEAAVRAVVHRPQDTGRLPDPKRDVAPPGLAVIGSGYAHPQGRPRCVCRRAFHARRRRDRITGARPRPHRRRRLRCVRNRPSFVNGGFPGHDVAGDAGTRGRGHDCRTRRGRRGLRRRRPGGGRLVRRELQQVRACRKGKFMQCVNFEVPSLALSRRLRGIDRRPATALARIPDALSFAEAAPMGCAGVTTFNALRRTEAVAGRPRRGARHRRARTSRCAVGQGDGLRDGRDRARRRQGRRRQRAWCAPLHRLDRRGCRGRFAGSRRRDGGPRDGGEFGGDGSDRRRSRPRRRTRHRRGDAPIRCRSARSI